MKIIHKVNSEDNLTKISQLYDCSVKELIQLNNLQTQSLQGIHLLEIPQNKNDFVVFKNLPQEYLLQVTSQNIEEVKAMLKNKYLVTSSGEQPNLEVGDKLIISNSKYKYYIVKPLDTLPSIAQKLDINPSHIIEINNLKTSKLFVGQQLII